MAKMPVGMDLKDDILFQLGGPVVTIELNADQLDYAIEAADRWALMEGLSTHDIKDQHKRRNYAVAMATAMLGRIRSKYTSLPGSTGLPGDAPIRMDGEALLRDARLRFEALGCGPYG